MHFNHANILKYCDRPFKDVDEMNSAIIHNWNSVVKKNDVVYCLGDVGMGSTEQLGSIVMSLSGRRMLICGNHDSKSPVWYMEHGWFEWASRFPIIIDKFLILSHEPLFIEKTSVFFNCYGHTHQNDYVSPSHQHFNCCVEKHDYTPVALSKVYEYIESCN
jgi:calcineurin-like phosphoesterase family protein